MGARTKIFLKVVPNKGLFSRIKEKNYNQGGITILITIK
jgi:hypothetical protein